MPTPKEILGRMRSNPPHSTPIVTPVPIQPVQPVQPQPAPAEARPERIAVPRPIHENSIYRQLMRSHDRMNTRHLKG